MSYLIALDDGHGMETAGKRTPEIPGLSGRVIHENEFNRAAVGFLDEALRRCGFETVLVAPGDEDIPLADRVATANNNGADAYVSIHYNAYDSSFEGANPEGLEIFHYPGSEEGQRLAECIHAHLIGGTAQVDRGVKAADFYVLRKTGMVAVLSENGFMDNEREALLMIDEAFQREVAEEHARGICGYFGVAYAAKGIQHAGLDLTEVYVNPGRYLIVSAIDGRALDLFVGLSAFGVWQVHGKPNQVQVYDGDQLINAETGKALDVYAGLVDPGARAIAWEPHDGDNQKVWFADAGDGYVYIVIRHSGLVLDVLGGGGTNGAYIGQWPAHGGDNQRWKLIRLAD